MNQPFNGRTAIRGAIMVMGSTYVTYALGLLTSVLVARTLGPSDFGRYTYMVWMAGLLIMCSNNGLTTTVIRFASESLGRGSPQTARSIHGWLRRWQLACVAIVTVVFLLTMPFFTPAGWEGHLAVFAAVVLGGVARFAGISLFGLMRHIKDELVLAFSSASSAAVMPQLMKKLETYGVPRPLVSFVVPVGYSFNLDGASLFLGIGTLFVAQLYGIDLSLGDQALLVVTMVLTSKGAAGVPGFMFVILSATLASAGLPLEGIAFIAGVYRLMEMPTTALNVLGNALAPVVIAKWEARTRVEPQGVQAGQGLH